MLPITSELFLTCNTPQLLSETKPWGTSLRPQSVRTCITKQKPQIHTENATDGRNVSFPKGPSQPDAHTKHFLVCVSAQFCTVHTSWFIISVCYRLNRAQGLNGFASSVCIPVGRPYSTCLRISFSHSFLQVPMSLLHRHAR